MVQTIAIELLEETFASAMGKKFIFIDFTLLSFLPHQEKEIGYFRVSAGI